MFNLSACGWPWRCLGKGMNAIVEIQTQRPVALELYKDFKELGRFMLRYVGSTIAAGVVTEVYVEPPHVLLLGRGRLPLQAQVPNATAIGELQNNAQNRF